MAVKLPSFPYPKKSKAKKRQVGTYSAISASRRRTVRNSWQKKSKKARILTIVATAALVIAGLTTVGVVVTVAYFSRDLPSPNQLTNREWIQSTKIFDRNGELLYDVYDGQHNRTLLGFDEMPQVMKDATIAAEDKDFYNHQGFSPTGIALAFFKLASSRSIEGGGSTITQQLVKNAILEDGRQTPVRKIKELILAIQIERRYTKDQILQIYLNEIPYGGTAYGIEAATQHYFGKTAKELTLPEAALLAGIVQNPTMHSPFTNPDSAIERQQYVLGQMERNGMINEKQRKEAEEAKLAFTSGSDLSTIKAPHFVLYVKQLLEEQYGTTLVEQGGLRVTTTLDLGKQKIAEEEVKKQLEALAKNRVNATSAGVVATDPKTGQVLAYVGSGDFYNDETQGKVDIIQRPRQPGSSVKTFTYLAALTKGYSLATYLGDVQTCFGGTPAYCPGNSDGKYWGPVMMREALANSRNIPAVKATQLIGVDGFIEMAKSLGVTSLNNRADYGLSIGLGAAEIKPYEMAQAYNTLANGGLEQELTTILKIEDASGKKVLEQYTESAGKRVIDEKYVYLISDVLSDNQTRQRLFGAGNKLQLGNRPAAVKTGTTDANWDAWTIGYTPSLATTVWVGNMDRSSMRGIQGSTGATPIWNGFMTRALQGTKVEQFKRPSSIVAVTVDAVSGMLPGPASKTRTELFVKGTEPTKEDTFHKKVQVDRTNGLLANAVSVATGNSEERTCTYLEELIKSWQSYTDTWMRAQGSAYGCPTETSTLYHTVGDKPYVTITSPTDGAEVGTNFTVKASAASAGTIAQVEFLLDGVLVAKDTSGPYEYTFNLSSSSKGKRTITARATDSNGNEASASVVVMVK